MIGKIKGKEKIEREEKYKREINKIKEEGERSRKERKEAYECERERSMRDIERCKKKAE